MKRDGADLFGIITDHGHCAGQDHFVVAIVWSGFDTELMPTHIFFCPSIDLAGHTAIRASQAIKNALDRMLGDDVEVFCATADAGGSGSIDNTYPMVQELGVMKEDSKETNCCIHGLQKSFENASKLTMGDQGLGTRSPYQMLWVFARMMSEIRERGGIKLIDRLWEIVNREMLVNQEWRSFARSSFQQSWNEFVRIVESPEAKDEGKETEALTEFLTSAPRKIQDPVLTRWALVRCWVVWCLLFMHGF